MWKFLLLLFLLTSKISTRRCSGRRRSGGSCTTVCNFSTGRWERGYCSSYGYEEPPSDCERHCINNSTRCEFKHSVGVGINFPPTAGDCNDERYLVKIKNPKHNFLFSGPCYDPDYCSRLAGSCDYYCEAPRDNVVVCTYELTNLRYENRPGVPTPSVQLAGDCTDR